MITLTSSKAVNTILGSATTVGYDKVVFDNIQYSPVQNTVRATLTLSVAADPTQTPLLGTVLIVAQGAPGYVQVDIPDVGIHRKVALTGAQQTQVQGWCQGAQNQVEQGIAAIGLIAGIQSNGI